MWLSIFAVIKLIPILDYWVRFIITEYIKHEKAQQHKEFLEGIRKLFEENDQRDLEKAIGSDNAGKPALNQDGVETRPRR